MVLGSRKRLLSAGQQQSEATGTKFANMAAAGEVQAAGEQLQRTPAQSSKSMTQLRTRAQVSAFQQQQQEPTQQQVLQQQQQVHYTCLDDFSSRVEIYKGRHSVVWNSVCRHTKKPIILKGYVKAQMTGRNFHQVRREIRLMSIIEYDGAVMLLGNFEDATTIYIVQEICAKGDLFKKLLRNGGSLEERYVAGEVILPLLLTLEHLHARGIFHRDIKPENIFFTGSGRFKLGDFGLAIDTSLERSKSRVGTLDYMSPEVVSLPTADERKRMEAAGRAVIEQPYGEKCDVWAAGVLAYELLVGRPPFEVADEAETRKKIMFETTVKFPPHVSHEAISFIKAVLAKNASVRPSAADLLHHPWLRSHLVAMAARVSHLDAPSLSAFRTVPSLVASSSNALVTAVSRANAAAAAAASSRGSGGDATSSGSSGAAVFGAAAIAGAGANSQVGRSASFSSLPSRQPGGSSGAGLGAHHGLFVNVEAAAATGAGAGGVSGAGSPAGSGLLAHHLQGLAMRFAAGPGSAPGCGSGGSASSAAGCGGLMLGSGGSGSSERSATPNMPMTPGPYGPPGVSRKPIWEADPSPGAFTAVRTTGMAGSEVPASPTSPRVGKPGGAFGGGSGASGSGASGSGGNSPLLKAALNANLPRLNAHGQSPLSATGGSNAAGGPGAGAPGSLAAAASGSMSACGALAGGGGAGVSSNVKQRLKEYFVARNTELAPAAAAKAGCVAGSDCATYSRPQQQQH